MKKKLMIFANNGENKIELSQCDSNALKVYEEYGGKIFAGSANYYNFKNKTSRKVNAHYWNVIESQIIDVYNYKNNSQGTYSEHNGTLCSIKTIKNHIATYG